MKVKTLKKILNTDLAIGRIGKYLFIGDQFGDRNIRVDQETLAIRDVCNPNSSEYARVTNILRKMPTEQLHDIMSNNDVFENPVTVYHYNAENGLVEETQVEVFGHSHNDINGYLQYSNTHYRTRKEAVKQAIAQAEARLRVANYSQNDYSEIIYRIEEKINRDNEILKMYQKEYEQL